MRSRHPYPRPPGHAVSPTSRWAKIVASVGVAPGEARVGPSRRGQSHRALRVDAVHGQAPAEQQAHRTQLRRGGCHLVEVADHGHGPGVGVEPAGMGALHGAGHPAVPALEHLTVLVDEGVVGDVTPPQGAGVVAVDRAHDAGGIRRRIVVAGGRVVDDPGPDSVVVERGSAAHRLIGTPRARLMMVGFWPAMLNALDNAVSAVARGNARVPAPSSRGAATRPFRRLRRDVGAA